MCKAPVKLSPPTNQRPFVLQAGCPSCHPGNNIKVGLHMLMTGRYRCWAALLLMLQKDAVAEDYFCRDPDHRSIYRFIRNLFHSAQLTAECAIVTLVSWSHLPLLYVHVRRCWMFKLLRLLKIKFFFWNFEWVLVVAHQCICLIAASCDLSSFEIDAAFGENDRGNVQARHHFTNEIKTLWWT